MSSSSIRCFGLFTVLVEHLGAGLGSVEWSAVSETLSLCDELGKSITGDVSNPTTVG